MYRPVYLDIGSRHTATQSPGDDIAGVINEDGRQVIPTPADDLEAGEVGLPQFVDQERWILELVTGLHQDVGGIGDQVFDLQDAIDRGFRHEVLLFIGISDCDLSW